MRAAPLLLPVTVSHPKESWARASVATRFALAFGIAGVILLGLVTAAASSLLASRSTALEVTRDDLGRLQASQDLLSSFYRMQLAEDGFLDHADNKYLTDFHEASALAQRALSELLKKGIDPARVEKVADDLERYRALFDRQEELLAGRVTPEDPAVLRELSQEEHQVAQTLDDGITALAAEQVALTGEQVKWMTAGLCRSVVLVLIAFLVALGTLVFTYGVVRKVATGLHRLTVEVGTIAASGSLDQRVEIHALDELGQLGANFNRLMAGLEEVGKRKRMAIQKLAASEETFRSLSEQLPVAISIYQAERLVWANAVALKVLGATRLCEVEGKNFFSWLQPDDQPIAHERYLRQQAGEQTPAIERDVTGLDGVVRSLEMNAAGLMFHGQPSWASFALDVTERKQLWRKLNFNERMVSLGTLAAGVAHEINNPIAFVSSNLTYANELVAELKHPDERWPDLLAALTEAKEGTRRVATIVKALKSFAREEGTQAASAIEVQPLVEFSISMARAAINDRAKLVTAFAPVPAVLGAEGPLVQVFLNLLMNAAQAIPPGAVRDHLVEVGSRVEPDGRVAVFVRDTGSGIGPEVKKHIFDPFFSTKPVGAGTGLGLSISLGIVQKVGGELRVETEPGQGSTFTVYLRPA